MQIAEDPDEPITPRLRGALLECARAGLAAEFPLAACTAALEAMLTERQVRP